MGILTLSSILHGKIFQISDYQGAYSWEEKQLNDFVKDLDILINDKNIISHYMGTIILHQAISKPTEKYNTKNLEMVEVIDGQQRLITISLYLSIIINELIKLGKDGFNAEIPFYLYSGSKCKLRFNDETSEFYLNLLSNKFSNITPSSYNQKMIYYAYCFLEKHIEKQLETMPDNGENYLENLFDAIVRRLSFSSYLIENEHEINLTIELINSRGKNQC
jgi:uncharacterized protein with ParB-like and HNH nuclease domain